MRAAARQVWGVAKYQATEVADDPAGQPIGIAVYGRDAADAKLLTKAGRFLFYRDSGPSLTITRLQQVEHEAYLTLRAGQAGVAVPEIVEAGTAGPSKDALLVYRLPPGTTLSEADAADISDATLDDLYRQLLTLRQARIAHGAISGDTLLVDPATETDRGGLPQRHLERLAGPARSRPGRRHRGHGTGRRRRTGGRRRGPVPGSGGPGGRPAASAPGRRSTPSSAGRCGASASCWMRSGSAPPRPSRSRSRSWWSPAG